jgi:hypothetical protein
MCILLDNRGVIEIYRVASVLTDAECGGVSQVDRLVRSATVWPDPRHLD